MNVHHGDMYSAKYVKGHIPFKTMQFNFNNMPKWAYADVRFSNSNLTDDELGLDEQFSLKIFFFKKLYP